MSIVQPDQENRQSSSPSLSLNLSSNNPFRNRAASPNPSPGHISPLNPPPRPVSRNPFLDASAFPQPPTSSSPDKMSFPAGSTTKPVLTGNAAELFDELTLNDKPHPRNNGMRPPPPRSNTTDRPPGYSAGRSENVPPRGPPGHRPSRSQEEAMRARRAAGHGSRSRPSVELDIFADPSDSPKKMDPRRVRRNSESSIKERDGNPLDPEEEKKRQERRRRERERRHRERDAKEGKAKKPDRKLDIIDQLDATSIYGTGLFHHDGPFDACNPHRNRQGSRRAPMQAFPKDSLNNVLGGGGPLNKRPDHATFLGNNDEEAFKDYSKGGAGSNTYEPYSAMQRPGGYKQETNILSATNKVEPIHGDETLGLGTSTFLEGAPASKTAMQRRASEQTSPNEGLSRKKSLAQKIRGMNNNRRDYGPSGRTTNPEGVFVSPEAPSYTPGGSRVNESNPFFNEFTKGDDVKKESITIVEPEKIGRPRAPSSPRRGFGDRLERRATSEGSPGADAPPAKSGGGFLSRVKSLKGGSRRAKAERSVPLPQES